MSLSCICPDLYFVLIVNLLPFLSCSIFFQKLSIDRSAWTLRLSQRLYAGAPKRTCWGQLKAIQTSLLHFMTLLPVETTRSVSLKVNTSLQVLFGDWLTNASYMEYLKGKTSFPCRIRVWQQSLNTQHSNISNILSRH